jgi:NADPH:quinone reductase-like Zn-dependent oxidoreductase
VDVPVPSPNKGEVLLKLEAASINHIDWKIQKGMVRPFLPRKFPFIPGTLHVSTARYVASDCLSTHIT